MGHVLVTYKVFPEDIVKNFDPLKAQIKAILPQDSQIEGWGEEPVAFGLVALLVQVQFPEDKHGIVDEFENDGVEFLGVGAKLRLSKCAEQVAKLYFTILNY